MIKLSRAVHWVLESFYTFSSLITSMQRGTQHSENIIRDKVELLQLTEQIQGQLFSVEKPICGVASKVEKNTKI